MESEINDLLKVNVTNKFCKILDFRNKLLSVFDVGKNCALLNYNERVKKLNSLVFNATHLYGKLLFIKNNFESYDNTENNHVTRKDIVKWEDHVSFIMIKKCFILIYKIYILSFNISFRNP